MPWHYVNNILFFGWKDLCEIAFFSFLVYQFSVWLSQDRQKNLLFYFYGYSIILITTHYLELATINTFLFISAPCAVMLFILIHQETLQKNFIALRAITPTQPERGDWLEVLIRSCLVAASNNKQVHGVIEHNNSLTTLLETPLTLYADLQQNLLTMLLESDTFDQKKLLWLNYHGRIIGLNAQWNNQLEDSWLSDEVKMLDSFSQDALFFTTKTDAIVFRMSPQTRSFDIIAQGKLFTNISAPHALSTIKKYLLSSNLPSVKGEINYGTATQTDSNQQSTH